MEESIINEKDKKDNVKIHLIGISLMVLTALVGFNVTMNIFAIAERREIIRQINQLQRDNIEARVDRETIKSKLFTDLSEIKALSIKQSKSEVK